jgi:hypothetical protein
MERSLRTGAGAKVLGRGHAACRPRWSLSGDAVIGAVACR